MKETRNIRALVIVIAVLTALSIVIMGIKQDWTGILDKITILFLCATVWVTSKITDHYRERV